MHKQTKVFTHPNVTLHICIFRHDISGTENTTEGPPSKRKLSSTNSSVNEITKKPKQATATNNSTVAASKTNDVEKEDPVNVGNAAGTKQEKSTRRRTQKSVLSSETVDKSSSSAVSEKKVNVDSSSSALNTEILPSSSAVHAPSASAPQSACAVSSDALSSSNSALPTIHPYMLKVYRLDPLLEILRNSDEACNAAFTSLVVLLLFFYFICSYD